MAAIGQPGVTHLTAKTPEEWIRALTLLLGDTEMRKRGAAGRQHVIEHYSLPDQAEKLIQAIQEVAK